MPASRGFFYTQKREVIIVATIFDTTQGCRLYFIDNTVSPNVVRYVDALKDFNGLGGDAKDIDITNQDSLAYEERAKGLIAPSNPAGTIIYNVASTGYQALKKLQEAGQGSLTQFYYAFGDAANTVVPTIVTGVLTPPQTASPRHWARSGWTFYGYVKGLGRKAPTNDVIMCDFKATSTGKITEYVKGELVAITH